jgi:hypothetical protein
VATFGTSGTTFGGFAIDRAIFGRLLPDARWMVYAAGVVDPGDGNTATVSLVYQKDDGTLVTLGSVAQTGGGATKKRLGPLDVFATGGVPAHEVVPIVRLRAQKNAGADGTVTAWSIWVRLQPRRT